MPKVSHDTAVTVHGPHGLADHKARSSVSSSISTAAAVVTQSMALARCFTTTVG